MITHGYVINWFWFTCLFIYFFCVWHFHSFFRRADPRDLLVAASCPREAPQRDAAEGRLLRCAAQSFGEDVPKTEVHQQAGPEEAGLQTGPERFTGRNILRYNHIGTFGVRLLVVLTLFHLIVLYSGSINAFHSNINWNAVSDWLTVSIYVAHYITIAFLLLDL